MESRNYNRAISPEESAKLEELVFDLVRERLLKAVGAGGMWTLQFRASTDTDSLFGETISEYIARDIANQIAAPKVTVELAEASNGSEIEAVHEDVLQHNDQPAVGEETSANSVDWSAAPAPAEAEAVEDRHAEHRVFRPRKAA